MIRSLRASRTYKIFVIAAALISFILLVMVIFNDPERAAIGDSVQYWAAARLMLGGENPYYGDAVLDLRHQVGNFAEFPQDAISMMLYPPWTIPWFLTAGSIDYSYFRILWLLIHICLIFISVKLIWKLYNGPNRLLWLGYLVAFTFEPTILLLGTGHITTLHLLGLIGFLYSIKHSQDSIWYDFAAGASLTLVTSKPQFLILFMLTVLLWSIYKKRWFVILGGFSALLVSSLISIAVNPIIFHQYWTAISQYDVGAWATPTLGGLMRLILGLDYEWLQIVPSLVGLVWLIIYWWEKKNDWDWKEETPLLVLISVVTAAYVWTYDMVLLLLPILQVVIISINTDNRLRTRRLLFLYFFVTFLVLILHIYLNDFWFFWLSPFILIWYLLGRKSSTHREFAAELS